ncbi:MAG: HAD-IA family hydrolase [Elusimicrobia bacterium]|nr:HAD-IA family hydrolase [Elusimicrobiota bacterium]
MIRALIFDVDNTLTDFMRTKRVAVESAVEGMIDAGLPLGRDEMARKVFDAYAAEGWEDQRIFDKVLKKELGAVDYKVLAAGIVAYRRAKSGSMALYPRVHLTLLTLARLGLRCVALSDAPKLEVWLRVVSLGLHHYFDEVVTSADLGAPKPAPEPFRRALKILGTKPEETLMVGDWAERDITGAKRLGIRTAWARYGDTHETKDSGADYVLADVHQLIEVVRKENGLA